MRTKLYFWILFFIAFFTIITVFFLFFRKKISSRTVHINNTKIEISLNRFNPSIFVSNNVFISRRQPDWARAYFAEQGYGVNNYEEWRSYVTEDVAKILKVSETNFYDLITIRLLKYSKPEGNKNTLFYEINFKKENKIYKLIATSTIDGWFTNLPDMVGINMLVQENKHWRVHFIGSETWLLKFPLTKYQEMEKLVESPEWTTNQFGQFIPVN